MNKFSSPQSSARIAASSFTAPQPKNDPGKMTGSFDPDLAARIEALEKQQSSQRLCPSCGALAKQVRLTCEMCGNYFERGVEASVWDKPEPRGSGLNGAFTDEEAQLLALKGYLSRRVVAKVIDIVIVGSLITMEAISFFSLTRAFGSMPQMAALMLGLLTYVLPILVVITILGYQAAFESSPVQASLGKLLLGLYVVDVDGKQARSEPLVFKTLLSSLPTLGFVGVYAYFFFTRLRYGIPLDVVSTGVLAMTGVACFVTFLALHIVIGSEKRRQTIPDLLTGLTVRERQGDLT